MRRSTVLVLGAAALVLAACEIRTDYDLRIADNTRATLVFEIGYDEEAAELFGPAESFLEEEVEGAVGPDIEGVTLVSAEADSSDPENQRVTATFEARDGEALGRLVADLFPGSSFTNQDGDTWVLALRPDADVAEEFGDEFALEDLGLDVLSGEVRVDHAGSQVSVTGGVTGDGNQVVWNPYGGDSLEVVMDLSGASPPAPEPDGEGGASGEEPAEEPAEEPTEEPTEEPAEEPAEEPTEEPTEESTDETEDPTEEPDAEAAATVSEDTGGLSVLLLALIGALVVVAVVVLVLVLRRGGEVTTAGTGSGEEGPVGVGPGTAPWPSPAGGGPSQPTQAWGQPPSQQPPPAPPPSAPPPGPAAGQGQQPPPPPTQER